MLLLLDNWKGNFSKHVHTVCQVSMQMPNHKPLWESGLQEAESGLGIDGQDLRNWQDKDQDAPQMWNNIWSDLHPLDS